MRQADPPPFYKIAVGELYNPARTRYPQASQWRLSESIVELVVFYPDPTPQEIEQFRTGRSQFALLAGDHALVLGYRFGDGPWGDSTWQAPRQTDLTAGVARREPDEGLLFVVALVDATTGVVKVLRMTTWSAQFTAAVRDAIGRQLANGATVEAGDREIDRWYARYPRTVDLIRAADITTTGSAR